jgi:Kef-type K+ transport system membrane component KefB
MAAGILLGSSVLNWMQAGPRFFAISDLSLLFVVLAAGLERGMGHVLDVFRDKISFVLPAGFAIPTAAAGTFAWLTGLALIPGLVVTCCLSVTVLLPRQWLTQSPDSVVAVPAVNKHMEFAKNGEIA